MSAQEAPAAPAAEPKLAWLHPSKWEGSANFGIRLPGRLYALTWNIGRALAPGDSVRSLKLRWYALLDALLMMGVDFCCLQETGVGHDPNDISVATVWAKQWSREQNTPAAAVKLWCSARAPARKVAGLGAGVALIALGAWAARGQPTREWADGSTLAVQFALQGTASLAVICQYAPTGGGDTANHAPFREATSMMKAELDEQPNTRQLWMGDYQFASAAMYRSSGSFSPTCQAWSESMGWTDCWPAVHPQEPGFTRMQGNSNSRIDYAFVMRASHDNALPADALARSPVATAAWVGNDRGFLPGNLESDHLPLLVELHEQRWLGSHVQTTERNTRPMPDTIFPPDRWFIKDEAERREVIAELARTGQKPKKLEYSKWAETILDPELNPEMTRLASTALRAKTTPTMANIAEAYDALDAMGLAVKNKLRPQRDAGGANSCRIKGEPTYGKDFADWIKLRR